VKTLAVGCGAGFSGDRTDAAPPVVRTLVERGGPAALIFENLAERTLAHQQLTRRASPHLGYEPLLLAQLRPVLADCLAHGITIVGNFGAANPPGAAAAIAGLARELGLPVPRIAVVTGDDLSDERGRGVVRQHLGAFDEARFVCANAYQGAAEIAQAIRAGAQVVVTGRVADPSLAVGPAMAHYGWREDDWDRLAGATMAGHLLECGAQVWGGYFADPGFKDVPGLADVGFPILEVDADGGMVVTKAARHRRVRGPAHRHRTAAVRGARPGRLPHARRGGRPDARPSWSSWGRTVCALRGVRGHARTNSLKVNVCHDAGWLAEGEISYAGARAEARARLAANILRQRLPGLALRTVRRPPRRPPRPRRPPLAPSPRPPPKARCAWT